jgi:hypothetical protein
MPLLRRSRMGRPVEQIANWLDKLQHGRGPNSVYVESSTYGDGATICNYPWCVGGSAPPGIW